ncbi:MAG: TetR/AcrR family transcriptional regulator [Paraglaciecola sp.]|nr:TetR/AcrR family transcriptional regulator [Paraglaciecola sp.]
MLTSDEQNTAQRARTDLAKDQRRMSLLMAALDEFFEKGFSAARMQDIAKRVHLSKGTLYLYFDSKQALFKALIEEVALPTLTTTLQQSIGDQPAPAALKALMQNVTRVIRHSPLPRIVKVIIADGKAFPDLVSFYRTQVLDRVFTLIDSLLQKGVQQGHWYCLDTALSARLVVAPILFSVIWRMVFEADEYGLPDQQAKLDLDALLQLHTNNLLLILATKPELGSQPEAHHV